MKDDVTNVQLTRTMNDMHRNIDILLEYDVCIDIDKIFPKTKKDLVVLARQCCLFCLVKS